MNVTPSPGQDAAAAERAALTLDRGTIVRVVVIAAKGSRSSVVFDLDGDGNLDVVTNEFNAPPQVLISDLAQKKRVRFLEVELRGTRSNRDGLGARVTLVTDRGPQVRAHDGKSGYLSQSRLPLWFGLADGEEPLRLEVAWPSGARQTVERPAVGTRVTVTEPAD